MNSFTEIFDAIKEHCKERVAPATYDLFFVDMQPVSFENNTMNIKVRSEFVKGVLEERYTSLLKDAIKTLLGFESEVDISLQEASPKMSISQEQMDKIDINGNYDYTFDNFIVGQNNKFAHAACLNVAKNPFHAWNPLFIYGNSGLGKTHLLFAIQDEISKNHPDFKICYVGGDHFTNEIIQAIGEKKMNEFHDKYRNMDILLVDDIQFIGGKESTQEEFFHTFNALYNEGKQIVLASDRPPKEIKSLDERLRTRFEWGLTADVQPPDFETRVAIIRRKASLLNLNLPDDVADYIAMHLKNNIRQLEGAVKKLNAYYLLEGIQPVLSAAQNSIKDILKEQQPTPVTIEKIISEVARTFSVSVEDIRSRKRNAAISNARMTAMYIVREVTDISMEEIGEKIGGRDHSTVVYACGTISEKIKKDTHLKEIIEDIVKNVQG